VIRSSQDGGPHIAGWHKLIDSWQHLRLANNEYRARRFDVCRFLRMMLNPTEVSGEKPMPDAIYQSSRAVDGMDEGSTLEDLVQSAQAGSHSAFGLLKRRYERRIFKQIISITRHHEDAEDALQDALCRAYVAFPLFEGRCHIYTWMSRIAINCALMKVRKRKGLREMSLNDQGHADDQEPLRDFPDPQWSPEEICGAAEWLRHITTASRKLDPISRRVLIMRANNESTLEEIADALNVSVSAAKARLYRARDSLRAFSQHPSDRDHHAHQT
jgi:RNA polymerase sigma-70 factor, ECF subfamily